MSTKVKGEAIKEGSIPLSALSNEVKGKIENASGANWEAKEDEDGYIENKPFGKHKVNGEIFEVSQNPLIRNIRYFIPYDSSMIVFEPSKKIDYIRVHWVDNDDVWIDETIKIPNDYITSVQTIKCGSETPLGSFNLDFEKTESEIRVYLSAQDELFSLSAESILERIVVEAITCLSDEYLPDTILKTTPQTLSDTDKNQALANLGIDPVVWKYMCNPCIITSGAKVPEELIGEYSEDVGAYNEDIDGPEGGYCLKYPIFAMYKIMITSERVDLDYGAECNVIITPTKVTKEYIELSDVYVSKDYGIILGIIYIDKNKKWKFSS